MRIAIARIYYGGGRRSLTLRGACQAEAKALGAPHLMLLSLPNGRPVTPAALRYGWDTARAIAARKADERGEGELADAIRALYLRDMRKRAAQKAGSLEAAAELLQHSDKRLTERHYGGVRKLKPTG